MEVRKLTEWTIPRLEKRYVEAFTNLGDTLTRLLRQRGGDVGSAQWMDSQTRRAAEAYKDVSREVLGPDGKGGVAAQLVEAVLLAGTLFGERMARLAGFAVAPRNADSSDSPVRTRWIQSFVSETQQLLMTALTWHREACERIRQASMLGQRRHVHGDWGIPDLVPVWARRALRKAVYTSYLDRLAACGVDVMYITGECPRCATCARAVRQRLFSISGTDPSLPPLSSVTVYAYPPLWHGGCKHPGVPYGGNGLVSLEDLEGKLWEYAWELGIGLLIFPTKHSDEEGPEPVIGDAED